VSSSSSSEHPAVAGFTIESVLGEGPRGVVFIATQDGLGRRVALKIYAPSDDRPDFGTWPAHPGVARLHVVGSSHNVSFTASQLAPGGSLAARLAGRSISREDALALVDQAEATLAHLPVVHGALGPGNVLIDAQGSALLCDFGMGGVERSADADLRALADLRARCRQLPSVAPRRRGRHHHAALVGAGALAVVGAVVFAVSRGETPSRPPAPLPGTRIIGASLGGGAVTTVGCDGRTPNGSAPTCSIIPLGPGRRPLTFPTDGVVRRWEVRGAQGVVTLQVVRHDGGGAYTVRAGAQPERVSGGEVRAFSSDLAVRRGDLLGLGLRPDAGAGIMPSAHATTLRLLGASRGAPRRALRTTDTALDGELELRVEYVPGGRARPVPELSGRSARSAPAGRRLASREFEFSGERARTLLLVLRPDGVVLDLLRGTTRLQRVTVVGADPRGTLSAFDTEEIGVPNPVVTWINPDGREILHHYRANATRVTPVD
jgi:hypothetical protein